MEVKQLLSFLASQQPMPDDANIIKKECNQFIQAIEFFKANKSNQCIPLFIFSISEHTGLGMYESISDVLIYQDQECVIKHLRLGLQNGNDTVKQRCCWWALDINAWGLEKDIALLTKDENEDTASAAKAFISLKHELT